MNIFVSLNKGLYSAFVEMSNGRDRFTVLDVVAVNAKQFDVFVSLVNDFGNWNPVVVLV